MKKYTLAWVMDPKHTRLTRATKSKPFPGKYPTRIAFSGTLLDGKQVSYIGKPTSQVIRWFRKLLDTYSFTRLLALEFDRNGVIARDRSTHPEARGLEICMLRKAYHPFSSDPKFFSVPGQWNVVNQFTKRFYVFWPDDIPYTAEMCRGRDFTIPPGVAHLPAQRTYVTWAPVYRFEQEQHLLQIREQNRPLRERVQEREQILNFWTPEE